MLIVDAQIHIWAKGTPSLPHRPEPFSADQALAGMDAAGVSRALLHPPSWDADALALSIAAVNAHSDRFAILGGFPVDRPECRSMIETWRGQPGALGLRFAFLQPHQRSWPTDGSLDWLWPAAERLGLPVAMSCSAFIPVVGQIAERHPGLKLTVDHMGVPPRSKGYVAFAHFPQLMALAKYANISVKASGGPNYALDDYPYRSLHGYYRQVYDAFGPHRMFWGTDITRQPCSWRQCVTMFTEELPWLPEADKALIMGRAVCDWMGWKVR